MNTHGEILRALVLLGGLAVSVCACKGRSLSEPGGAPGATSAEATSPPALWEPIDKNFKGCEGG